MAAKVTDLKKYLKGLNEEELRAEVLKLFKQLKPVKDFYTQELMSGEDRKQMLEEIKSKIYREFWTPSGNPRNANNAKIRKIISDFEKVASFPYDVIDLILHRVEVTTDFGDTFGGMPESFYDATSNSFTKAVKLIKDNQLHEEFKVRCEALFQYDNLGYGFIDDLEDIYNEAFQ